MHSNLNSTLNVSHVMLTQTLRVSSCIAIINHTFNLSDLCHCHADVGSLVLSPGLSKSFNFNFQVSGMGTKLVL